MIHLVNENLIGNTHLFLCHFKMKNELINVVVVIKNPHLKLSDWIGNINYFDEQREHAKELFNYMNISQYQ